MQLSGIINDLHLPFHDPHAVALSLEILKDAECERIYLNGDVMDFYNINSHGPKHPIDRDWETA